ncbi:hypothetical protein ID866_9554, partial [Astraeus odoratus]
TPKLAERIHAIWYCLSVTDYERSITAAEQKFFGACDTKHVPVIVLFTKTDVISDIACIELLNKGYSFDEAQKGMHAHGVQMMRVLQAHVQSALGKCEFPPNGYVQLAGMNTEKGDSTSLLKCTTNALNEEALQLLLVSTQKTNIHLCVEWAVKR